MNFFKSPRITKKCSSNSFYQLFKYSRFFDYVTGNRDNWVKNQAATIPSGSRVLDIGAGSCPYRKHFLHCQYKTHDFAALSDQQLRDGGYGQIDYISDISSIPVEDESFDVAICTEVIEHVPDPISAVKEMGRLLKPGGLLLLTAPLGSGIHQAPYHFYGGYTPFWYERFLRESRFDRIVIEPNGGFFKMFGWECIRFVRMLIEVSARPQWWVRVLVWLGAVFFAFWSLPVFILCDLLDRFDRNPNFTAGYHVVARKKIH